MKCGFPRAMTGDCDHVEDEPNIDNSVLIEARNIVRGRDKGYGNPVDSAVRIANAFTELTGRQLYPRDIPLIQMLFKLTRSEHKYNRDNQIDLAGYVDIRERCLKYEIDHNDFGSSGRILDY